MKSRVARTLLAGAVVVLIAFAVAAGTASVGNAGMSLNTFAWSSHLTAGQAHVLSAQPDQRVIVLLKNQHTALTGPEPWRSGPRHSRAIVRRSSLSSGS